MNPALLHALLHIGGHAVKHMTDSHQPSAHTSAQASSTPTHHCSQCEGSNGQFYKTKCCSQILCGPCMRRWLGEGGKACKFCNHIHT